MKKNRGWVAKYEARMDLTTKAEKIWFRVALILLILYMEFVAFGQNTSYGGNAIFIDVLTAAAIVPLCIFGVDFFHKIRIVSKCEEERQGDKKKQLLLGVAVFTFTFLYCFAWQRAYWPGSFSADSFDQYRQAVTGEYSNWHPALHTWLFFTLPYTIFHGAAGIVTMQLVWFSAAVTYLCLVLYRNGASKLFLLVALAYILANPNTANIMLYPWKDSAFSIFSLVIITQVIQIYATKGIWLKKWYNLLAFSSFCFLAMNMRHNALLLVIPLLIILLIVCNWARIKILIAMGIVLIGTIILQGPVFNQFGVETPENKVLESVGLPMTVLCNIYVNDRDSMPQEVRSFMDELLPEAEWSNYRIGSFNSVKWNNSFKRYKIEYAGLSSILKYTLISSVRSPKQACKAFIELTKMVWSIDGEDSWGIWPDIDISADSYGIGIRYHNQNKWLLREISSYSVRSAQYVTKYLFKYIGIIIIFLLFLSVGNIGNGNLGRVFVILAPMAYNFGTMLLLSTNDFRFFHFNFLIAIPLTFLIGMRKRLHENA